MNESIKIIQLKFIVSIISKDDCIQEAYLY